ncbi:alpha-(1,3)-fucosyltransferase C-like [Paramacrobiotus metropolitanus]|uniref:alpha-(1,3)-fucosyltransferase C-like n=1 Tax=Paramacrobiotus metropolitanus TaxID=2943436 RepID=UPI00244653EC|nr:alpha-(1,3)-fucosyltransferase C-like [Paramacrobiotus metropolitanus]
MDIHMENIIEVSDTDDAENDPPPNNNGYQPLTAKPKTTMHKRHDNYYCRYYGPPAIIVVITLLIFAFYLQSGSLPFSDNRISNVFSFAFDASPPNVSGRPIILFWTKFFGEDMPYLHDRMEACRNKCFATDDRRYLSQSAAVIFHIRDFHEDDLPPHRTPEQLYVFFLMESPPHTLLDLKKPALRDFFNLTWTYRLDSDIFSALYFDNWAVQSWVDRSKANEFLQKKLNRSVFFSSNCHTPNHREDYVTELEKHFPVDVFGKCGKASCQKGDKQCEQKIIAKYKFYLAFENSNCLDYVTEKPMRALNFGTVPIVMGGANYSAMFPKNSLIDSGDFKRPAKLAEYLRNLTGDFEQYQRLFEWRFNSAVTKVPNNFINPADVDMCKLCELLHNRTLIRQTPLDLSDWWSKKAQCTRWYAE